MWNFLICSTRASCSLAVSTSACTASRTCVVLGERLERRCPRCPCCLRPAGRDVGVEHDERGVVGAARRRSPRPGRSAARRDLSVDSMFAGDMFLPAALMISSFLRSTILR